MTQEQVPFTQWASVHRTDRFISIEPLSGYRRALREDEGYVIYLKPDVGDEALGRGLLEALDKSRFIHPDDERSFFKWERIDQCFRNWEKDFMRRCGYKTKRDAYKNMNWCQVERSEGVISIRPRQRRAKPGEWLWLPPEQNVVISETRDAAAVGAALRLAWDRCEIA
ncbi:MAG TPA: contact-dependent growth inhibition system immunity protein [Steroidobacteraceae bacterium]|nr:contact-dependent growth inhibition system immunity protein [Steroidobacteraceae bacterium]